MYYFYFLLLLNFCYSEIITVAFREDLWTYSGTSEQFYKDLEVQKYYNKNFDTLDGHRIRFLGTTHTKDLTPAEQTEVFANITTSIEQYKPDVIMFENFVGGLDGVYVDFLNSVVYSQTEIAALNSFDEFETKFSNVSLRENVYTFWSAMDKGIDNLGWEDLSIRPTLDVANDNYTICWSAYLTNNGYYTVNETEKTRIESAAEKSCEVEFENYHLSQDHLFYEKINRMLQTYQTVFVVAEYGHLYSLEANINNLVAENDELEESSDPPYAEDGTIAGMAIGFTLIICFGMYLLFGHGIIMTSRQAKMNRQGLTSEKLTRFNAEQNAKQSLDFGEDSPTAYQPPNYGKINDEETPEGEAGKQVGFANFEIEDAEKVDAE